MKLISTIGDPNGIGIEILLKSIRSLKAKGDFFEENELTIAGETQTIEEYASKINASAKIKNDSLTLDNLKIKIINCGEHAPIKFGEETKEAVDIAAKSIETALAKVINEEFDALVTMPVSKAALYKAGWNFPGHTEALADACNVKKPTMILLTKTTRVALVTIHLPLQNIFSEITQEAVTEKITTVDLSLKKDFGVKNPKIALLGLNPHAGEEGSIGKEEQIIISPAIEKTNLQNIAAEGPFPADSFFARDEYKSYDGIIAMYHDQGLIPLKLLAKGAGVNYTANLPIVRTSPDHGTAFALAGKDKANPSSAIEAFKTAVFIKNNRINYAK